MVSVLFILRLLFCITYQITTDAFKIPYANEIKLDSYVDRLVLLLTFFCQSVGRIARPCLVSTDFGLFPLFINRCVITF